MEINQIVTEQVAAFVRAAVDTEVPTTACRQLLSEAARTHSGAVLACSRAGGSDRFLTILSDMVEVGEEEPELYKDPVYKRSRPRKLISNCFKTHMAENGCFMKDGTAIWLHFEVEEGRYVAFEQSFAPLLIRATASNSVLLEEQKNPKCLARSFLEQRK